MLKPINIYYNISGLSHENSICKQRIWLTISVTFPNRLRFAKVDTTFTKSALKGLQC